MKTENKITRRYGLVYINNYMCIFHPTKLCKIIASNDPSILEVPTIPEAEPEDKEDIDNIAKDFFEHELQNPSNVNQKLFREAFCQGYKKALIKNKYTEDDMMDAYSEACRYHQDCEGAMNQYQFKKSIQRTPIAAEVEMMLQVRHGVDWYNLPNQTQGNDPEGIYQHVIKVENNQIVVTKWIYK